MINLITYVMWLCRHVENIVFFGCLWVAYKPACIIHVQFVIILSHFSMSKTIRWNNANDECTSSHAILQGCVYNRESQSASRLSRLRMGMHVSGSVVVHGWKYKSDFTDIAAYSNWYCPVQHDRHCRILYCGGKIVKCFWVVILLGQCVSPPEGEWGLLYWIA